MASPRRIVSLLSSATEMLFAIGAGDAVLAVSHECDFPPAAKALPRATFSLVDSSRTSGEIDVAVRERLAAGEPLYGVDLPLLKRLRPELIVTQAQCDVCAVRYDDVVAAVAAAPELRGCEILALNPYSLADVLSDIARVGAAARCAEQAAAFVASLEGRLRTIGELLSAAERPRAICIEWFEPLMTAGNWTPELIALAGGDSGLAAAGAHSAYVTWDSIRAFDPDILLAAPCGFDLPRTLAELPALTNRPGWYDLRAVQSGRAFAVDGNAYFNRSGPRLVDTVEILAELLHPRVFPPKYPHAYSRLSSEVNFSHSR